MVLIKFIYLLIAALEIFALFMIVKDIKGLMKKLVASVVVVAIGLFLLTAVYVTERDGQAYENAKIVEITNLKFTEINAYKIGFVYWEEDDKVLRKGAMSWGDVVIGDQVALGVKEDVDYITAQWWYGHEKVKYLKLTEEKLDELTAYRKK